FLLRVSGMSMKDIGIMDGDLLAVHKTQDVRNGQVVVARIDDEGDARDWYRVGVRQAIYHRGRDAQASGQQWGEADLTRMKALSDI
ncbi:hypothetical protein MJL33_29315, partial [Salmonella enterica subsp. enterica serovar Kentucky]|nr:hypothetical protein [Salmonella enterica subsp. enterica serovar Kentucky]